MTSIVVEPCNQMAADSLQMIYRVSCNGEFLALMHRTDTLQWTVCVIEMATSATRHYSFNNTSEYSPPCFTLMMGRPRFVHCEYIHEDQRDTGRRSSTVRMGVFDTTTGMCMCLMSALACVSVTGLQTDFTCHSDGYVDQMYGIPNHPNDVLCVGGTMVQRWSMETNEMTPILANISGHPVEIGGFSARWLGI
jgi:hypothetical protein